MERAGLSLFGFAGAALVWKLSSNVHLRASAIALAALNATYQVLKEPSVEGYPGSIVQIFGGRAAFLKIEQEDLSPPVQAYDMTPSLLRGESESLFIAIRYQKKVAPGETAPPKHAINIYPVKGEWMLEDTGTLFKKAPLDHSTIAGLKKFIQSSEGEGYKII